MSQESANSVVLSVAELRALSQLASPININKEEAVHKKKQLQESSKQRYKNWNNTLEAQRAQKNNERIQKLEELESHQKQVDLHEEQVKATIRKEAIDKAAKALYQETDRVKEFNSGLLLASVLKERELQIEMAKKKRERENMHEKEITNKKDVFASVWEREEAEAQERKEKADEFARIQLQQLQDTKARQRQAHLEEIHLGEMTKKMAIAALEEQKNCREKEARTKR